MISKLSARFILYLYHTSCLSIAPPAIHHWYCSRHLSIWRFGFANSLLAFHSFQKFVHWHNPSSPPAPCAFQFRFDSCVMVKMKSISPLLMSYAYCTRSLLPLHTPWQMIFGFFGIPRCSPVCVIVPVAATMPVCVIACWSGVDGCCRYACTCNAASTPRNDHAKFFTKFIP